MSVDIIIQETVNEVDITVNQNVITVNVTRTTGSGGVESINGETGVVVLTTDNVNEGLINLYFTAARVRETVLTGISFVSGIAITATDTILSAFGKLQKQISSLGAVAFSNNYNDLDNKPTIPSPQNLSQTLAIDNKTNDIPIISNNGKARVDVNDDYLYTSYEGNYLTLDTAIGVQLYSDINVVTIAPIMAAIIDGEISYTCSSFTLNGEEVATQDWVTSQGYGTGTVTSVTGVGGETTVATGTTTPVIGISSTYTTARDAYADAKVADNLTASTTVAPSKTAVNTALGLKQDKGNYRKLVAVDAGNTTHTGTLTETIVSSILIPANSLDALCDLFFSYDYGKNNPYATMIKVYLNTSNTLTGATLFASFNAGSSRNGGFFRKMILRGTSLDTQYTTASAINNYPGDLLYTATNVITLNPEVTNYMLVTITLTNSSDIITSKRTALEKLNLVP